MLSAVSNLLAVAPRTERGKNARKPINVLLSDVEKREIEAALKHENVERAQDLGVGSKLRELGLLWARARREKGNVKK